MPLKERKYEDREIQAHSFKRGRVGGRAGIGAGRRQRRSFIPSFAALQLRWVAALGTALRGHQGLEGSGRSQEEPDGRWGNRARIGVEGCRMRMVLEAVRARAHRRRSMSTVIQAAGFGVRGCCRAWFRLAKLGGHGDRSAQMLCCIPGVRGFVIATVYISLLKKGGAAAARALILGSSGAVACRKLSWRTGKAHRDEDRTARHHRLTAGTWTGGWPGPGGDAPTIPQNLVQIKNIKNN